ncbi:MAG: hypothetical protein AAGF30_05945 [Pseudomonadota bacterium]
MRRLVPSLTIVAMILALLAPRMGAAAAEILPGKLRVVVICAGSAMQTIVIDAQGEAIEIAETAPCIATDLVNPGGPTSFWHALQLAWTPDTTAPHLIPRQSLRDQRPPGRAPPHPV